MTSSIDSEAKVAAVLMAHAVSHAAERGYTIAPSATNQIQALTVTAAGRIFGRAQSPGQPPEVLPILVGVGKTSFGGLIDAMIASRPLVYADQQRPLNMIGEDTLDRARAWLCPLWPVCE